MKIESDANGKRLVQFVLTQSKDQVLQDDALKIHFKGSFALISLNAENQVLDMYIGEGDVLQYGVKTLKSDPKTLAAYIRY